MESIKCTANGCSCVCYSPIRSQLRICSSCQHGWVAHAMDKIGQRSSSSSSSSSQMTSLPPSSVNPHPPLHNAPLSSSVDASQANCLFDVASLILFGSDAIPTRLKILLDRLFLHLQRDLILQILASFGWTYDDYCRGYRIQDGSGQVLDKWTMATSEEERVILDQFQRFNETKSIAEEWLTLPGQRSGQIPALRNPLEGHGLPSSLSSPMDVKQILLNGSISRASDVDASRHLFSSGAYLSSLLPRYPSLYSPFLSGAGLQPGSVGQLSQASVLPYLLARSPLRSLPKPMDFRMEAMEFARAASNAAISHSSPAKRNGKISDGSVGKEEMREKVKMEETREKRNNSVSSNETNFQSTDEDEPINYSTKDDRLLPRLSQPPPSSSSIPIPRNPSMARSPGDQSSSSFNDDEEGRQLQQSRKSSSSSGVAKKPYQPTPGYGGTLISPNGKKRVLCTACLKTFCDKGALKIHYSAVHLKELHMCTIDGCTMTFSSRRSRNRHSANPNPKLHFGQTGRRRLHNNSSSGREGRDGGGGCARSVSSPFREGQETTLGSISPPGSPRSAREGSPAASASEGELQVYGRSEDGLDSDGATKHQPMIGHEENEEDKDNGEDDGENDGDGEDGDGLGVPHPMSADVDLHEHQGRSNSEDVEEEKTVRREAEDTWQQPQRVFHATTSKRKSAIPTRCSLPPTEDLTSNDLHSHDLDPSVRKRRRLIGDHVVFDDAESTDGETHQKGSIGNGKAVELETGVTADEEYGIDGGGGRLMTSAADDESIVDLSRPSLVRSQSCDSSETGVEDNAVTMPNEKAFAGQAKRESEERDSASGLCEVNSESNGIEGFQGHFQAGPVDVAMYLHGVGHQRSIHVCKVQGCSASFPSKRSRDRHSANANLHRRLFYSDSIDQQTPWRKEEVTMTEDDRGHGVSMTPIDERKKSLDTVLNLTTNATDQMEPNDIQHQPKDMESKVEERVEISHVQIKESQASAQLNEETEGFSDNDSTVTDSPNRNHSEGDAFHGSAKNFCVRKSRNLLAINENLHNHLLVNSNPVSAQLAV